MSRQAVPLAERKLDVACIGFFLVNLLFITYIVDFEQLVVPDPAQLNYPLWPPAAMIDLVHWYGRNFDPLLMARPPFWMATIWLDSLLFGPYYVAALYAFWKGRDWIRLPSIMHATVLFTNVVFLFEEASGRFASPSLPLVVALNLTWLLMPIGIIARMWRSEHPFTREFSSSTAT